MAWFNFHQDPERAYPSDHRRIPEPLDGEAVSAPDKQQAVDHYTAMAAQARLEKAAEEDMPWTFEGQLGHAMLRGEIDASAAMVALDDYERWLEAGQPKLTTLEGPFIFH